MRIAESYDNRYKKAYCYDEYGRFFIEKLSDNFDHKLYKITILQKEYSKRSEFLKPRLIIV